MSKKTDDLAVMMTSGAKLFSPLAGRFFFSKGRGTYIKSWHNTSTNYTWKIWNKKYIIFYLNSTIVFFPNGFPRTSEPKWSCYAEFNDQPQNIGHAARSNASELVQNASKSLKEYWQLHYRYDIGYRIISWDLEFLSAVIDDEINDLESLSS